MKVVFLSGPFRAPTHWEVEQNIRAAEETALEVWRAGAACICPHCNTRHFDGVDGVEDSQWLEGYLAILEKCDALLLLPGWQDSRGAWAEAELARKLGIPTFDQVGTLRFYLEQPGHHIWERRSN